MNIARLTLNSGLRATERLLETFGGFTCPKIIEVAGQGLPLSSILMGWRCGMKSNSAPPAER